MHELGEVKSKKGGTMNAAKNEKFLVCCITFYVSISLPLLLKEEFPLIKNCETRLIRGRKLLRVTQTNF